MQRTTLLRRTQIAEGTIEFTLERPLGFDYQAGQSVDLTLIDPPDTDSAGASRTFTLASAPHEPELKVASRMRDSAFKRSLAAMPLGSELLLDGPFGSFVLHENGARPAIMLAGGIGITPFRAMIADAAARTLPHPLTLLYSNRLPEQAAYLEELAAHPHLRLIPVMTREHGHITAKQIREQVPQGSLSLYYLAGPQPFVTAMRAALKALGVSGDDIRFEEFAGY